MNYISHGRKKTRIVQILQNGTLVFSCQTVRHDTAFLQPDIETENLALIHSNFVRPQSLWLIIKD